MKAEESVELPVLKPLLKDPLEDAVAALKAAKLKLIKLRERAEKIKAQ